MKPLRKFKNQQGFTLVEMLIATAVVSLLVLGFMGSSTALQQTSQAAYERSLSFQDANHVVELMRDAAATGTFPANVTGTYSNGGTVSGFTSLSNESVSVSYANASADPLDATVTVSYKENGTRVVTNSVRTYITQRTMSSSSSSESDHSDSDHSSDHSESDH